MAIAQAIFARSQTAEGIVMDYELKRSISDIQSKIANIDHRLLRHIEGGEARNQADRLAVGGVE